MNLKIAAIDDEIHVLERLERMIIHNPQIDCCGLFDNPSKLLDFVKNNNIDAIFMDIEMPIINGLDLCEKVMEINENIDIVFLTAYNNYAIEAFEVNAVDYITKPLSEERLQKTLKRLTKRKKMLIVDSKPKIQCFGSFELIVSGENISWKNSKAKEIFAYLVHKRGVPVNWEKIADVIWPDYDADKAHANFHATTYLLRKRLSELGLINIVEFKRGNYRIVKENVTCDYFDIEEKLAKNQVKRRNDYLLFENLLENPYMDENGYEWAYPKAGELTGIFEDLIYQYKSTNQSEFANSII